MSDCATKADLKNATYVDISNFADLVNLKSNVDKLDINKLKILSSNLSKLKIERDKC